MDYAHYYSSGPGAERYRLTLCRNTSFLIGAAVLIAGCVVLVGWAADIQALKTIRSGLPSMKVNTALCFVLCGLSLLFAATGKDSFGSRLSWLAAFLLSLIAAFSLLEYLMNTDLGIDELFVSDPDTPADSAPGRMSIATALSFILLSLPLMTLDSSIRFVQGVAQLCVIFVLIVAGSAFLGYIFGAESFELFFLRTLALHTSVIFLVTGVGILLASPEACLMAPVTSWHHGSSQARWMIPLIVCILIVLNWLVWRGVLRSLYQPEFAFALSTMISIIFIVSLVWLSTNALNREEEVFTSSIESAPVSMLMINRAGCIVMVNKLAEKLFGYERSELMGKPIEILVPRKVVSYHPGLREEYFEQPKVREIGKGRNLHGLRKNGEECPLEIALNPIHTRSGLFVLAAITDISERVSAQEKILRLSRFHKVLSDINNLIVKVQSEEELFEESSRIAVISGELSAAWIGTVDTLSTQVTIQTFHALDEKVQAFFSDKKTFHFSGDESRPLFEECVRTGRFVVSRNIELDERFTIRNELIGLGIKSIAIFPLTVDDEVRALFALHSSDAHSFDDEELSLLIELAGDVSFAIDSIEKTKQLEYLVNFDSITSLPNRFLLQDRLTQALFTADFYKLGATVYFLDIDRFKRINDSLGHHTGDEILRETAKRIQGCLHNSDTVARQGSDEFVIVTPYAPDNVRNSGFLARALISAFQEPFETSSGKSLLLTCSIGLAEYPQDGTEPETLVRRAEQAKGMVKQSGGNNFARFAHEIAEDENRVIFETALRQATREHQLALLYQPKVDIKTGLLEGVEALVRWHSPEWGTVPPNRFIPLAEETGIILEMGEWIMKTACEQGRRWQGIGIAVNLSALQFLQNNLVDMVSSILKSSGLAPPRLELEITESIFIGDRSVEDTLSTLMALKELGVHITMDDFGTGYSSLSYLRSFPFDTVKIDKSFIDDITRNRQSGIIVKNIIAMSHSLGHKIIAEGVETREQLVLLESMNCDQVQGFLVSKPVSGEEISEMLTRNSRLI